MISKLKFSLLFAEAWLKALTPVNIVAGFRKCGIYPFNREAIPLAHEMISEDVTSSDSLATSESLLGNHVSTVAHDSDETTSEDASSVPSFTPQEVDCFTKRYEEGYDVYIDKQYVAWLQLHHPEALPHNVSISVCSLCTEST